MPTVTKRPPAQRPTLNRYPKIYEKLGGKPVNLTGFGKLIGASYTTMRNYQARVYDDGTYYLPAPDFYSSDGPTATPMWFPKTVLDWNDTRPGPGNWKQSKPMRQRATA